MDTRASETRLLLLEVSNGKREKMCGYHAQLLLLFSVSVALSVPLTPATDVGQHSLYNKATSYWAYFIPVVLGFLGLNAS